MIAKERFMEIMKEYQWPDDLAEVLWKELPGVTPEGIPDEKIEEYLRETNEHTKEKLKEILALRRGLSKLTEVIDSKLN